MSVSISGDGIISGVSTLTTGNVITTQSISAPTATFTGNVSIGGTLTYEDVTNIDSIGIITARSGVIVTGVTTVSAGSTSAPSITPTGDSNTGVFFPSPDTIAFAEGGVEAARFDSSGRLLVGTSISRQSVNSGNSQVQIHDQGTARNLDLVGTANSPYGPEMLFIKARSGTNIVQNGDILGEIKFIGYDGTTDRLAGRISVDVDGTPGTNDMPGRLVFSTTADGASSPTERMRIDSSGLVTLAGPGIKFPATQVASADPNTLDDYEEGTFTPTVIGSGTAGTASYTVQTGRYTKFGRLVQFEIYLFWGGGTGTNDLRVEGLPFTANNAATFPAVTVAGMNNLANSANNYINAYIQNGTTQIYIMQYPISGGTRTTVGYDAAGEILLSGTYST